MFTTFTTTNNAKKYKKICDEINGYFTDLLSKKVLNKELAIPLDQMPDFQAAQTEYVRRYHTWNNKLNDSKIVIAKHTCLLIAFFCLLIHEGIFKNEIHYIAGSITMTLMLALLGKLFEHNFGWFPTQSVGIFFLPPEQKNLCELKQKFYISVNQAHHIGPLSFFRCNNNYKLKKVLASDSGIRDIEHEAILRGLFGYKNNAFDCMAIATLVVLKLIEKKIATSIERVQKRRNAINGHSFVIVNRHKSTPLTQINDLNDDCILICCWYGVCFTAKELKENPRLLLQYPLLDISNKYSIMRIMGNAPPKGYQLYLELLNGLDNRTPALGYSDVLCPRL